MQNVGLAGLRPVPVAGATTPVTLAVATALILPTSGQKIKGGALVVLIVFEGTAAVRFTVNGVAPTAGVGHLTATPTATNPVSYMWEGDELLSKLQFIQTAATTNMTYEFFQKDSRL